MAQENEHIQKLVAARDRMISDRRALAEALASLQYVTRVRAKIASVFPLQRTF